MEKSIVWNGDTITYFVSGSGPFLLLIHGFGEDHHIFDKQVGFLQNNFSMVAVDLPGTGKSVLSKQRSLAELAESIYQIIVQEKIEKIHVCGHSMGGYIAMEYVKTYPDTLSSLTLFHSSAFADDDEKIKARQRSIEFLLQNSAEKFLWTTTPNLFYKKEKHEKEIETLVLNNTCSAQTLIRYYKAMIERNDNTEVLRNIKCPVLFIAGEFDKAVPLEISLKQTHLPDVSFVYVLKESGHMGMLEETEKCNEILAYFLQQEKQA